MSAVEELLEQLRKIDAEIQKLKVQRNEIQKQIKEQAFRNKNVIGRKENTLEPINFKEEPQVALDNTFLTKQHQPKLPSVGDSLRRYKKRPGTTDSGKEFEYMMCALYALKLCTNESVTDFCMTTNNVQYGDFDDISLEITFSDETTRNFLFQLKHKENKNARVTDFHLASPKNDFSLIKYLKSFNSLLDKTSNCILFTNSSVNIASNFKLSNLEVVQNKYLQEVEKSAQDNQSDPPKEERAADVTLEKICAPPNSLKLLTNDINSKQSPSNVFQFKIAQSTQILENVNEFCEQFYFFADQDNVETVKLSVREMLYCLLQSDIYDSFITFMKEWWSRNFILTKHDVLVKLSELALHSYMKPISDEKENNKTKYLANIFMKFDITIVKNDQDAVAANIWEDLPKEDKNYTVVIKYRINDKNLHIQNSKILWYLNKVPLIIKMNEANKTQVKCALDLLERDVRGNKKKILVLGCTAKKNFPNWDVFENLSDSTEKCKEDYGKIINTFKISLQGREPIALKQLLNDDDTGQMASIIETSELLEMSQESFMVVGDQEEKLQNLHIPRSISMKLFNTNDLLECHFRTQRCIVIINCGKTFQLKFNLQNVTVLELTQYLKSNSTISNPLILLCFNEKCTSLQFHKVCKSAENCNISLIQLYDDEYSTILLRKGDVPLIDNTKRKQTIIIHETEIFEYFPNSLNVLCAPAGMGKSTLLQLLSRNCPSDYCSFRVNLINHNSFLNTQPDNHKLLNHFLKLDKDTEDSFFSKFLKIWLKNKKIHLFLDGLDEIDSKHCDFLLSFVKHISSEGISVWIASRENLREKIQKNLSTIPMQLQDLKPEEQEKYINNRLKLKYQSNEIEKIVHSIFTSTSVTKNELLLGIPLQLFIITENFLTDDSTYKYLSEHNIFVLTTMYKQFFDGKKNFQHEKTGSLDKEKQTGYKFNHHLTLYEVPALMSCLNKTDFDLLNLDISENRVFINDIKLEGDKFGIIKQINEENEAVFSHQTYAEYFACVWFKKHKEKACLLREQMFSEHYENLKLIFDIIMAEESSLHLAVIYKNFDTFERHISNESVKDDGGRSALHLACSYGVKHPTSFDASTRLNRESQSYINITEMLLSRRENIFECDDLFKLNCVDYSLRSQCLFPLEKMLEKKLVTFEEINEALCKYYEYKTVLCYASQAGYPNLLSAIINEKPSILNDSKFIDIPLLHIAVLGCRGEGYTTARKSEGNVEVVNILLKNNVTTENALKYACKNRRYEMVKILIDDAATFFKGNSVLHVITQHDTLNEEAFSLLKDNSINVNAQNDEGKTALHIACQRNKLENVNIILKLGADVNIVDNNGMNALHYAVLLRDKLNLTEMAEMINILDLLISRNINVNLRNKSGATPLHFACSSTITNNVYKLIRGGADLNVTDIKKNNVLHYASRTEEDNDEIIDLLVNSGIDVNGRNQQESSVLLMACKFGNYNNVQKLVALGADLTAVSNTNDNALHFATRTYKDNSQIIDLLVKSGIDVNTQNLDGASALLIACQFGNYNNVQKLIVCGANLTAVNGTNTNALLYANETYRDNTKIIELLVNSGIDVNARNQHGSSALLIACEFGSYQNINILLDRGANLTAVDNTKNNALHYASKASCKDNIKIIDKLINCGIDVNARNKQGSSALLIACECGNYNTVEILIARGADLGAVDNTRDNVLHYASRTNKDNIEIIELLINSGVDVNARNQNKKTSLLISCKSGNYNNLHKLTMLGADLRAVDISQDNALHYASRANVDNIEIIDMLINSHIDVNTRNQNGKTALLGACLCSTFNNVQKLIACGADLNNVDHTKHNALHYASQAIEDNMEIIDLLINSGIDINARNQNGSTALLIACKFSTFNNVGRLIEHGADLNAIDNRKHNALYYAEVNRNNRFADKLRSFM